MSEGDVLTVAVPDDASVSGSSGSSGRAWCFRVVELQPPCAKPLRIDPEHATEVVLAVRANFFTAPLYYLLDDNECIT